MSSTSTKLRRAWIYHPNLYLDTSIVFGSSDRHKRVPSTETFIDTVNFILRMHSGLGVNKLAVMFELRKEHAHDIDGWVSFAVTSKARVVTLNFSPYHGSHDRSYNFQVLLAFVALLTLQCLLWRMCLYWAICSSYWNALPLNDWLSECAPSYIICMLLNHCRGWHFCVYKIVQLTRLMSMPLISPHLSIEVVLKLL